MMKVYLMVVAVGVGLVSAMPQELEDMPPQDAEIMTIMKTHMPDLSNLTPKDLDRLHQTQQDSNILFSFYMNCMAMRMMIKCNCTEVGTCPMMQAMMNCRHYEMKSRFLSKMVPKDRLLDDPFPITKEMFPNTINKENCDRFLPPPKQLVNMVLKDDASMHQTYMCMSVQGHEDEFLNCVLPTFHDFLPLLKSRTM